MANEYVSAEQLKATLELTGTTFADADIQPALTAASRAIEELCGGRRFYTTTVDETRYFTPYSPGGGGYGGYGGSWPYGGSRSYWSDRLKVGDIISVTTFQTDPNGNGTFTDTWASGTDYTLEPFNNALDGKPYRYIVRHPRGQFFLPSGYPRSVKVVGKFGWTSPPAEVAEATTILASRLIRRKREAPFGVVTVGIDVGAISRISRMDPDVAMLLQPYMEAPFA